MPLYLFGVTMTEKKTKTAAKKAAPNHQSSGLRAATLNHHSSMWLGSVRSDASRTTTLSGK